MSSTTDKIKHAAARNQELITILSQTDHAHSELEQQDRYISDLTTEIAQSQKVVSDLDGKRKKEFKEHASYRDSVMKRFAYKVVGKKDEFAAKAEKEETEYFEALQEEHKAQELLKGQQSALQDAQAAREEMVVQAQRHDQAQHDLDALYEEVFDGPSPGFPDEDAAEERRKKAREEYMAMRSRAEAQNQGIRILYQAMMKLDQSLRSMDDALRHSRRDMWGGGTFTDMMERNALSKAEVLSTEARLAVSQAQRFDPQIEALPQVNVPQGDILMDVFFDNVFTDMMFHEKIKNGIGEMQRVKAILEHIIGAARMRGSQTDGEVMRLQVALEKARLDLQKIREREFVRVLGREAGSANGATAAPVGGGGGSPPPAFSSIASGGGNGNRAGTSNNPFWQ